jgi:hypothetical protein
LTMLRIHDVIVCELVLSISLSKVNFTIARAPYST